ncbi:hypothetical protein BT96DRAFT_1008977 [Gymnopus androsaceus JB14]|uniref:Uncharacterized protein n=1 Tax=Gymnopus androsaceus JB14 TaxID=1447944 RepID=A0A6A4GDL7_9AGAR|nr:hypothetical protein BT96DRAFT_1008977 [Gymnopus androsaceus JB14]
MSTNPRYPYSLQRLSLFHIRLSSGLILYAGGSHDRMDFLPFKAGVSVMALGAMVNDPTCQVKIVSVGLITSILTNSDPMFKQGGSKKRKAVSKLLDLIYDALKMVTFRAPDYNTLMLIQVVRRLFKMPTQHLTLGQVVELNRRLLNGYTHFKDEPRIQRLREDVLKYNWSLRNLGIRDHQVPRAQKATWKTLGLLLTPLLYACYSFLAAFITVCVNAPFKWRILAPLGVFVALPFINLTALKSGEAGVLTLHVKTL